MDKLKYAGAIKESFYPDWLVNIVVVKQKNGKLCVYVDFTDLNKVCLKDLGHPRMSFLDAFLSYHQIPLSLPDQEKTAFQTPIGNLYYRVMPFGLKNAGSTYRRMMTRCLSPRLGRLLKRILMIWL